MHYKEKKRGKNTVSLWDKVHFPYLMQVRWVLAITYG